MRAIARPALAVLGASVLAGCAAAPPLLLKPMPPATLGESVEVRQQVTATFNGHTRVIQVALKVAPPDLTLIGLSAIGERLFTLSTNGAETELRSGVADLDRLDPDRILADLELAYWPLPALRSALDSDLRLEEQGSARMLWRNGNLLWFTSSDCRDHPAVRWTSALTIYNATVGYRLDIRALSIRPATP